MSRVFVLLLAALVHLAAQPGANFARADFDRAKRGLERSYAIAEEKKKAINPFGRLVNMEVGAAEDANVQISARLGRRSERERRAQSGRCQ